MVGAGPLSQGGDGRVEHAGGIGTVAGDVEAGAGEEPFGTQQRRKMSDRVGVEQRQELERRCHRRPA